VKVGADWQVCSKPGTKVNVKAVTDTLDALARLEADHYATDKTAKAEQRQLYALKPPTLTLEIETAAGKRTLQIGGQEGGSGRYYAAVAGAEDAPVFVIGEEDARKIMRPLQAFVGGAAKDGPKGK
jgi:hypothetical protein